MSTVVHRGAWEEIEVALCGSSDPNCVLTWRDYEIDPREESRHLPAGCVACEKCGELLLPRLLAEENELRIDALPDVKELMEYNR